MIYCLMWLWLKRLKHLHYLWVSSFFISGSIFDSEVSSIHDTIQYLSCKEDDLMNWRLQPIKIENAGKNLHENAIDAFK